MNKSEKQLITRNIVKHGFVESWNDFIWKKLIKKCGELEYRESDSTMSIWGGLGSSEDYAFEIKIKNYAHFSMVVNFFDNI